MSDASLLDQSDTKGRKRHGGRAHYQPLVGTTCGAKKNCRDASTGDFHHMALSFAPTSTAGISSQTRSSRHAITGFVRKRLLAP